MPRLLWWLYRLWIGCHDPDCAIYYTWPAHCTISEWHRILHRERLAAITSQQAKDWRLRRGRPVPTDFWWLLEAADIHPGDLDDEDVYWRVSYG